MAPVWLLVGSTLLLVCCIYAAILPEAGASFDVKNFFSYMLGLIVIFGSTAIYKLVRRTQFRDSKTADLLTGRHYLSDEEILEESFSNALLLLL